MNIPPEALHQITDRIARSMYVVLARNAQGKVTLLVDPGLNRPWSSKNKKLADWHASQCRGEAHTFESAWKILQKEYPLLERDLLAQLHVAAFDQTVKVVRGAKNIKPVIDQHGNPTA